MSTISNLIFKNEKHYITSPFGYRKDPVTGKAGAFHSGTDYGTNSKKIPQFAIEDGYCFASGKSNSDGANYVWVIYPRIKKAFLHYHLDTIGIKAGAKVVKGTKLGTTGMTGKATGIHLHLGIRDLSKLTDTQIKSMTWVNLRKCEYIDPEKVSYKEPTVEKSVETVKNSTTKRAFKVGDRVKYNGKIHYISANSTNPKSCVGGIAEIRQIYMLGKSKHPYLLVRVSGKGSTVWGWVDEGTFTLI